MVRLPENTLLNSTKSPSPNSSETFGAGMTRIHLRLMVMKGKENLFLCLEWGVHLAPLRCWEVLGCQHVARCIVQRGVCLHNMFCQRSQAAKCIVRRWMCTQLNQIESEVVKLFPTLPDSVCVS